jgi:hypothetical protein
MENILSKVGILTKVKILAERVNKIDQQKMKQRELAFFGSCTLKGRVKTGWHKQISKGKSISMALLYKTKSVTESNRTQPTICKLAACGILLPFDLSIASVNMR